MAVRIENISVKGLGPIENFSEDFGIFNLIYSLNERGKTFLTEFIIRSLFKNIKRWSYVRKGGNGKIRIRGLDKNLTEFSPSSKNKLEDFWENDGIGLPPSIVNILVAKGAEAAIDDSEEGINKRVVKEILSGINILDQIDNDDNISKTVKSATWDYVQIKINRLGEGKDYNNLIDELDKIEKLFEDIENKYSRGVLETNKINQKALEKQLEDLNKAKLHEAFLIYEKIKKYKDEINNYPEDEFSQLTSDINLYKNEQSTYDTLKSHFDKAGDKCKHYPWLKSALSNYKELSSYIINAPNKLLLIIPGISSIATIIFILSDQPITSIVLFLSTISLIGIYIKKYYDATKYQGHNEELVKIEKEFKNRIGKELTDIATIESELHEQEDAQKESRLLQTQLEEKERTILKLQTSIQQNFSSIVGEKAIKQLQWDEKLINLKRKRNDLKSKIDGEEKRLIRLGVDETDYLQEDIGIKYSQEKYIEYETELEKIQRKITEIEKQLNNLKFEICNMTKDDPSISWEELLENLHKKRQEKHNELKEITSKIIAGITVHNIIKKLRKEEDAKILESLDSETIIKPLRDLTNRYNRLTLENDNLIISDGYNNFYLKDLSTGAREQVMLALRIGLGSKLLKQDSLFLILDDAFQHSDWEKREILIKQLANIAATGWQIIYLTMDNHIKNIFDKVGEEFKDEYKSLNL